MILTEYKTKVMAGACRWMYEYLDTIDQINQGAETHEDSNTKEWMKIKDTLNEKAILMTWDEMYGDMVKELNEEFLSELKRYVMMTVKGLIDKKEVDLGHFFRLKNMKQAYRFLNAYLGIKLQIMSTITPNEKQSKWLEENRDFNYKTWLISWDDYLKKDKEQGVHPMIKRQRPKMLAMIQTIINSLTEGK